MEDKTLYEMYHNANTKTQAQEIALAESERRIKMLIYNYNGTLCVDDKEDIAQDCRIAILQALDTYDYTKAQWSTWCSKYLYNAVYNSTAKVRYGTSEYMRSKYNIQHPITVFQKDGDRSHYDGYITPLYGGESAEDIAIVQIERAENAKRLYSAVQMLPKRQKSAIAEYYGLYGNNPYSDGNPTKDKYRSSAIRRMRDIYGITVQNEQNIDRTGQKIRGAKNRPIVIVRYNGCLDADAIMRDGDNYYLIVNSTYDKLRTRDILRSNCTAKYSQIDADTQVYGKRARDYF